jgi:MFS family permease
MWSRLSDHTGRKPVLMTASSRGIEIFVHDTKSYAPGYGRTYNIHGQFRSLQDFHCPRSEVLDGYLRNSIVTNLFDSRCIAGLLNGNIGVAKSMMGELTDSTNRAQVSGLLPMVWAVGATIGYVTLRL